MITNFRQKNKVHQYFSNFSRNLTVELPKRSYEELLKTPFENCFTKVVVKAYPQVQELLNLLSQFGKSYMSGSGSSCFVAFDTKEDAQNAKLILD